MRRLLAVCLIAALVLIPFGFQAAAQTQPMKGYTEKDISGEKMALDLVLVRPVGILATVFGGAVFIVGRPFSALGGNTKDSYQQLIEAPATFTFVRPLGDL